MTEPLSGIFLQLIKMVICLREREDTHHHSESVGKKMFWHWDFPSFSPVGRCLEKKLRDETPSENMPMVNSSSVDVEKELEASLRGFHHLSWERVVGRAECNTPLAGNSSSNYAGQVVVSFLMDGQRKYSSDSRSSGPAKAQVIVAQKSRIHGIIKVVAPTLL